MGVDTDGQLDDSELPMLSESELETLVKHDSCRVVRCDQPHDVYIGRPSKWGNPFVIGRDGARDEVIAKYEEYVRNEPGLLADLYELRGKVLGCWCYPLACHGDVLARLVEEFC